MYQYFGFNILLSCLVFAYLYLLKTAPFRVRFRMVLITLFSWLVPYDLVTTIFIQDNTAVLPSTISSFNTGIKHVIVSQIDSETYLTLLNCISIMTFIGFIWFIKDVVSLNIKLQNLSKEANLYKIIKGKNVHITNNHDIFSIGVIKPKVYIGEKYLGSLFIDSIIKHEIQHIESNDQLWLLLITLVQRLLWWNPIVNLLAQKSRELIELSCDQACKEQSTDNQYQEDLAQILIQTYQESDPLASNFFGKSNQNIFRIKQLSKEFKMNKKHKALIFSTALIPFVLMLFVSTTSISSDKTNIRIENKQGERAENEVDLTIKFNALEYKKEISTTMSTTNLFEHRSNIKYEEEYDFIQGINTGGEDRIYGFKATPKRVDDEKVLIDFKLKYTISGKEITETPSLMVLNGTRATIVLDDETDEYKFEIEVLPRF